jgi:hypothetical protein
MTSEADKASAVEAKNAGNVHLKAGRYGDAVAEYTRAIDLDPENAVYYSNRCAAYLKQNKSGDLKRALEDAEECIRNKRDWAKGYARKGTVLSYMGKRKESVEAFEQALEIEPNNSLYKESLNEAKNAKAAPLFNTTTLLMNAQLVLHAAIILCTIASLILGNVFFYHALKASVVCQVITVLRAHGAPKWNAAYGAALVKNVETHYIMPGLVMHLSSPILLALVPACIRAAVFLSEVAVYYGAPEVIKAQASKLITMKWQLQDINAQMEVAIGCFLLLSMITGPRNFILLMMFWQYLRVRYMISGETKRAFGALRQAMDGFFYGKYCPGVVAKVWEQFKRLMARMGDAQAASQSRCTVM